jgi:hypothetical protein
MTLPPDPAEADPWAEEDEWQKLAEELGAVPPKTPERSPSPSAGAAAGASSAPDQPPPLSAETYASAIADEIPDWESSEDTAAAEVTPQLQEHEEATGEPADSGGVAPAPAARSDAEEDEEEGGGRKRRRRRRRRRKGGNESAPEAAPSPNTAAASADVPETGEAEELPGGASAAGIPASAGTPDWSDTTDPDQAAEVLRDILAHWNVPSWDEIVAGLYRPER